MLSVDRRSRSSSLPAFAAVAGTAALLFVARTPLVGQDLEQCQGPVGTLAVVEPQDEVMEALSNIGLKSPTSLIRMMVQESGCFIVVERGRALDRMAQERDLARSGELTGDANVGAGQMQAADFYLTPDVLISDNDAGGVGGAVGGLLGRSTGGLVGGGLKFKEAKTSILITATRSGVQVASAEGEAKKTDFALGGLAIFSGVAGVAAGGYTSTDEGKVIAASFLDNYNNIVGDVRGNPSFPPLSPDEVRARMTGQPAAGGGFAEGDVVGPKMDNIEVYTAPSADADVLTRVGRSDTLVYLGMEDNGFLQVQSPEGAGWVRKILVTKR
jgi:curli biogenesis system outer membrane secretion channel CsgG